MVTPGAPVDVGGPAREALVGPARFTAVLAVRPCARSPHFYVHHLPSSAPAATARTPDGAKLSTGTMDSNGGSVDHSVWRLGMIIPKRHAKRSVTRTLVKRQVRALWGARLADLPPGDWLVRLRAPIDRAVWTSAASAPLAQMLATELRGVLDEAVRRTGGSASASAGGRASRGPQGRAATAPATVGGV